MKNIIITILILIIFTLFIGNVFAQSYAPNMINYQGFLTDQTGTALNGSYQITFALYSDSISTASIVWGEETHDAVNVENGLFNVLLGSIDTLTAANLAGERYLGIRVGGDSEMTPRLRLSSSAYSLRAEEANTLDMMDSKDFVAVAGDTVFGRLVFSGATQQITTAGNEHLELIPGGNVGIGRTNPAEKLDVNGHVKAQPVCARWYATNNDTPSPANYEWGNEVRNTNNNYLSRTANNEEIEIHVAGYYMVCVNVLQAGMVYYYQRGDVYLNRNGVAIGRSLGHGGVGYYKHVISIVEYFSAGDKISVYMHYSGLGEKIYAPDDPWSSLEIYRLN